MNAATKICPKCGTTVPRSPRPPGGHLAKTLYTHSHPILAGITLVATAARALGFGDMYYCRTCKESV